MAKKFLGIGWKFPVRVDNVGKIAMSSYEEDIEESILIILGTAKGERVMRPNFGCGIHSMVFETINTTTLSLMEMNVREALTIYEPRIELIQVSIHIDDMQVGRLLVNLDYRVRSTNNRFNLVYPFYLTEGG